MTNAELIQKIKAEIERLKAKYRKDMYKSNREGLASGYKIEAYNELLSFLSTLESEKPINSDDAMKELDEKIALVKQRGTWDGVDVDKYMDDVRGREPEKPMNLEEEVKRYYSDNFAYISSDQPTLSILTNIARHFAEWQKEQDEEEQADLFTIVALDAAQRAREQMMREAVEGVVCYGSKGAYIETDFLGEYNTDVYGNPGDKVRVIVCKKEDKKYR